MDSLVKQRLVGALILVALAVVFWPIIFLPGDGERDDFAVTVPPAPPIDRTPLAEPDSAGLRSLGEAEARDQFVRDVMLPEPGPGSVGAAAGKAGGETGDDTSVVVNAEAQPGDPASDPWLDPAPLPSSEDTLPVATLDEARDALLKPQLDDDGLPIAFSLQVATMADRERAEALRDELVAAGYKGYVKRLRRDDRVLYRVLVGPRYQRDDLVPVKAAIDNVWHVDSLIIRYLP